MLNSVENRLVSAAYAQAAKAERERDAAREAMRLVQAEPPAIALEADAAKWKAEARRLRKSLNALEGFHWLTLLLGCTLGVLIGYGLARGLV